MQWYDGLMIAVIAWSALQGARKGLALQIAPIASLVCGYIAAFTSSDKIAHLFGQDPTTNRWIAMLVVYLGTSLGIHVVTNIFRESIASLKMQSFDNHLGSLFGAIKGGLVCLMITFFAMGLSDKSREIVLNTKSGSAAGYVMHRIEPVLPGEVHDWLAPYVADLPDPKTPAEVFKRSPTKSTKPRNIDWDLDQNDRPKLISKEPRPKRRPSAFETESSQLPNSPFLNDVFRMVDKAREAVPAR